MCEPLELFLVSFYPVVCPNAGQTPPLFSATFHNPDHATANRTEKRSGRHGISFLISSAPNLHWGHMETTEQALLF